MHIGLLRPCSFHYVCIPLDLARSQQLDFQKAGNGAFPIYAEELMIRNLQINGVECFLIYIYIIEWVSIHILI